MTKAELEAQNEDLRDALAEAREQIRKLEVQFQETLGDEDEEDDEEE